MIGKRRAELAEGVLADFYKAREVIASIRHPASYPEHESRNRERGEDESAALRMALDSDYVPIARLMEYHEFLSALLASKYRMKAYFGSKVDDPFSRLNAALNDIRSAASSRMRVTRRARPATQELHDHWEQVIWAGEIEEGAGDPLAQSIDEAISQMERICAPVLEARK